MHNMDGKAPEGGSEIGATTGGSLTAAAELETRVESLLYDIRSIAREQTDPARFEALRTEVLELVRSHAARAVLEAVTSRFAARDRAARRRRPSRR